MVKAMQEVIIFKLFSANMAAIAKLVLSGTYQEVSLLNITSIDTILHYNKVKSLCYVICRFGMSRTKKWK